MERETLEQTIIGQLRDVQEREHKSQGEFARELGISQSMLSQLYSGKRKLTSNIGERIARQVPGLRLELSVLFFGGREYQ